VLTPPSQTCRGASPLLLHLSAIDAAKKLIGGLDEAADFLSRLLP